MRSPPGRLISLLLILAAVTLVTLVVRSRRTSPSSPLTSPGQTDPSSLGNTRALIARVAALDEQERRAAETIWAPEMLARRCGQTLDRLWDAFNQTPDRWALLSTFAWPPVALPQWESPRDLGNGIHAYVPTPTNITTAPDALVRLFQELRGKGWQPARLELRHMAFATNASGGPSHSTYAFQAWMSLPEQSRRAALQGDLTIEWAPQPAVDGSYRLQRIDATHITLVERQGPVPFDEVLFAEVEPPPKSYFIDPVLIHDLNQDGSPEIILAARNLAYHRQNDGHYAASAFCPEDPGLIFTGLLADLNQDGFTDFVCARREGLVLFSGGATGLAAQPGKLVWSAPLPLRYGQVLTCADVDRDGDADLWLGQYKTPFERGQMPSPYYDANDGYPAYLLLNDGQGRFTDGTAEAGLAPKRYRRTYSGSLVDLNRDQAPDLVVVSDFAGIDFYLNNGQGHFTESPEWFPDPEGFGMAHTFGDFDSDGRLDLFVTGMHCPAAHRLDELGLRRPGFEQLDAMRARMTRGNRLYQRTDAFFGSTPLNRTISRSGWSWSPAAADFDNDGHLDLAIANGHETHQSVVDYESEFWTTDIYVGSSADDLTLAAYFGSKFARTRGQGQSYGGYEANRLYLSQQGQSFVEAGWLLGVAVEQDSRNAVAADLNGDGRTDLVVTTFEAWPRVRQTVRVLENHLPETGHWIGVHLNPSARTSPLGARIRVQAAGRTLVRLITSGDLHRAQQPWSAAVGLGSPIAVDRIQIEWPTGARSEILSPTLDRYHAITAP